MKRRFAFASAAIAAVIGAVGLFAAPAGAIGEGNPHPVVTVYVTSQGLCYDSIVTADLPDRGPFQTLAGSDICGEGTLMTEFGPGDPGYLGGRWETAAGDHFMCPLVGPGYLPPQ